MSEPSSQILERGSLTASPPLDSKRLQVLYDVVETLVANLHLDEILPAILETLDGLFRYDRCAIAGRDPSGDVVTWASRPQRATVPYSRSIVQRVLERGEALLYDDIQGEVPFAFGESVVGLNIRSVLCSPLTFRGQVKGLVYLDRSVAGAYTIDDLALLRSVSHLMAIALENARLYADIKARYRKTANELGEVQRRLIESERTAAMGHLAQTIAHEVRNPVMVIGGLARRLAKGLSDTELARNVQATVAEAARLERMMQRIESLINLPEASFKLLPLEVVGEQALGEIRQLTTADSVRIRSTSTLAMRPIPHDPVLTRIALVAMLQNAVQAAPPGSEIHLSIREVKGGWAFEVAEAGPGEETEELKEIFDPFFASHPWAVDLGFALAQKAMAQQGGELRVEKRQKGRARIQLLLRQEAYEKSVG
jgi:K+-sensing histidine kinase KdpD